MKRALLFSLAIATVIALPALSQDDAEDPQAKLEAQVEALTEAVDRQGKEIEQLKAYVAVVKAESKTLAAQLQTAEKEGFLYPAPHVPAKKALLHGLQRYANAAATGKAPDADK